MSERAKRIRAVRELAGSFKVAHDTIDDAIQEAATVIAIATMTRRQHGLSEMLGQKELDALALGLRRLVEARGSCISAHHGMAEIGVQTGMLTKSEGDLINKPTNPRIVQVVPDAANAG